MGWNGIPQNRKKTYLEIKEFMVHEFNWEKQHIAYVQIFSWNEIYVAVNTNGHIWAALILYSNTNKEFKYKIVEENMGPYYFNANKKLLNMLSETKDELAKNWREHCKKNNKP